MDRIAELKQTLYQVALHIAQEQGRASQLHYADFFMRSPKNKSFGEFESNIGILLARDMQQSDAKIGELIAQSLKQQSSIGEVSVAKNAFINFSMNKPYWQNVLSSFYQGMYPFAQHAYGQNNRIVMSVVWDVTSEETLLNSLRAAVLCDAMANIMEFSGYEVLRKCYTLVDDSDSQIADICFNLELVSIDTSLYCFETYSIQKTTEKTGLIYQEILWCGEYSARFIKNNGPLRDGVNVQVCERVNLIGFDKVQEGFPRDKRTKRLYILSDESRTYRDTLRLMMLFGDKDTILDLNYAKITDETYHNPAFCVQYAHSQIFSVFRNTHEIFSEVKSDGEIKTQVNIQYIETKRELEIIRILAEFSGLVEVSCVAIKPHRVAFYLYSLASGFRAILEQGKEVPQFRIINVNEKELTLARIALLKTVVAVLNTGLKMLGIKPVNEMR